MADDKDKKIALHETEHEPAEHSDKPEAQGTEASKAEAHDTDDTQDTSPVTAKPAPKTAKPQQLWQWALRHKQVSIPAAVVALLAVVFALPFTRYAVLGLFLQQEFSVVVQDSKTSKPISDATVTLDGKKAVTDKQGKARLRVAVGEAKLVVTKDYYKSSAQEVLVPVKRPTAAFVTKLQATGRQVPVTVTNKISGQGIDGATVAAEGTEAKTDAKGQTILVVPADKTEVAATVTSQGYNKAEFTLKVTDQQDDANNVSLAPSGTIYFLSNASGKIDLAKSDLDGSNRKVVLAGTGKEDRFNTVLFASRDWEYIALLSKRDGGEHAKLFLVETKTDKLTTMDEGDANFTVLGWSGDRFVYRVDRTKVNYWESKRQSIKSYHAPSKKITALFDTSAEGTGQYDYASESIGEAYVLDQEVVFVKNWDAYFIFSSAVYGKQATLQSVRADGSQKKIIKTYPGGVRYIYARQAEFGEIYIQYNDGTGGKNKYDEYKDGKVEAYTTTDDEFYNGAYPAYAVSPSGQKTLWSDFRDGKYVFFVGDESGENGKQIGSSEDFTVYGWFTDSYILLTRKGSELRILPVAGLEKGVETSLKISDYYKPNYGVRGYGYGYGG